jgi:hypothetical protein
MWPCGSRPLRKTPGSHRSHSQSRIALDLENAAQRISNQTGSSTSSIFTRRISPHRPILLSQDRSIARLRLGRNAKSHWDTGTFAPRGSASAIWEAIRRADLPAPPRTSMMRTHTRTLRNSNRRHHRSAFALAFAFLTISGALGATKSQTVASRARMSTTLAALMSEPIPTGTFALN